MKKSKFASLFLASSLLVGMLAGCGAGEEGSSSKGGESSSANGGETIKIGANLELSGAVASYGTSEADAIDLAVEEINADGGIDGKKIELIKVDNKSDAAEATSAAIKLTSQDKVVAIIGAATSGASVAQVQIATDTKTPMISPSGTSTTVTVGDDGKVNPFTFRTAFIDPFQGTVAANFASNELKVKTAAVYADNASDYAKGLAASFIKDFEAAGGTIVAEESYVAKDTDFRSTLTRIKSSNPEFVFIPGYYEEVGLIVKQARELGINVPLMGADGWDSPTIVDLAGADALNNTFIITAYSADDPDGKAKAFAESFNKKYGKEPNSFNALGYDSVYLLKDAIERAGSTDGTKIKEAIEATDQLELVTGLYSVDENHHPIKSAVIIEFVDGKQVFNTKVNP
ncbi:ABC transporter substrate-binding protein [Psychrobacillus lasiicapitis]|uniref:ABC transporter substrate-binding protein n=1 Tax=Psychrobacillus lasiicapitis TaxID=1636719 RepID=A0A544THA2_9BACI|nr:ABC transporter substrate-binding protein [Psychrobacillus lasiicapitis]TQR16853.1 ABC transporter substrate-binding protein [Psychrobacillus lasiicapitis]GGA26614.1 ethanolamine utilization protein EutJ [Psychrobacillus lasiicapitis]